MATLCWLMLETVPSLAQPVSRVYKLETVDQAASVIPYEDRFQFPQFQRGIVSLWGGKDSQALLNYSYLYNELQFLSEKKDTLSIIEENLIRFVSLAGHVYLHDKLYGYAEIIADSGKLRLAVKKGLVPLGSDKYVGYGQYVGVASSVSMRSYLSPNGQFTKLKPNTNLVLATRTVYFFIDQNNKFYPASEANCRKIFSRNRQALDRHLKNNKVDFDNEDDLRKLLAVASGW